MRATLLALAAFLVPHTASAEAWRLAAYSNAFPKLAFFVDIDSISRYGTKVSFRQMSIYDTTTESRDFTRSVFWRDADCSAYTSSMRKSDFYVGKKFLGHEEGPGGAIVAKPGTVLMTMLNTVCGRGDYFSPVITGDVEVWALGKFASGF
ncbi:surface-adhesin E family protein [Sphingomonas soli]|uniref:surface-adhesin E family protein n=1 Tax=Sphingomonas soli TaxID=266127 RepID=UPI0008333430|nr:surface-adhesin E family protein [Sphingomonas soli]